MSCHVIHNPGSINSEVRSRISQRYKRVTKAINREFWESDNENSHSLCWFLWKRDSDEYERYRYAGDFAKR